MLMSEEIFFINNGFLWFWVSLFDGKAWVKIWNLFDGLMIVEKIERYLVVCILVLFYAFYLKCDKIGCSFYFWSKVIWYNCFGLWKKLFLN